MKRSIESNFIRRTTISNSHWTAKIKLSQLFRSALAFTFTTATVQTSLADGAASAGASATPINYLVTGKCTPANPDATVPPFNFSFANDEDPLKTCVTSADATISVQCNENSPWYDKLASAFYDEKTVAPGGMQIGTAAADLTAQHAKEGLHAAQVACDDAFDTVEAKCTGAKNKIIADQQNCKEQAASDGASCTNAGYFPSLCEKKANELLSKIDYKTKELSAAKVALGVAVAAGVAGLTAMLMKTKETKKGSSSTASTAKATAGKNNPMTTANTDAPCQTNDFTCLCQPTRNERPLECASACPFTAQGFPDVTCLQNKYGANYASSNLGLDKNGNVINLTAGTRQSEISFNTLPNTPTNHSTTTGVTTASTTVPSINQQSYTPGKYNPGLFKQGAPVANDQAASGNTQGSGSASSGVAGGGSAGGLSVASDSIAGSSSKMDPNFKQILNRRIASDTLQAQRAQIASPSHDNFKAVTLVMKTQCSTSQLDSCD